MFFLFSAYVINKCSNYVAFLYLFKDIYEKISVYSSGIILSKVTKIIGRQKARLFCSSDFWNSVLCEI